VGASRLFLCFHYRHKVSLADLRSFGFITLGGRGASRPQTRGEGWCVHASSQMREKLFVVISHEPGLVSEDVIAKRDESRSGTW
jgi:hypothetical protein